MKQSLLTAFLLLSCFSAAGAAEMKETHNLNGKAMFFDWHYSHYEEPGLMTVKSRFPFSFSVGFRDETNIRSPEGNRSSGVSWNIEGAYGLITYDGSGTYDHSYYKLLFEGYYSLSGAFFGGIGYRRLFDDFGPGSTSTSARTFDRMSEYVYAPLGYNIKNTDGSNLKLQFNFLIKAQQTSYTSQVPGNLSDLVNDQNEGFGFDVSYANPEGSWEVYYRYWSIENSEISPRATIAGVRYGFEPKNKTSEIGVRYRF